MTGWHRTPVSLKCGGKIKLKSFAKKKVHLVSKAYFKICKFKNHVRKNTKRLGNT